jgi:CheY-like chemotaxis protein
MQAIELFGTNRDAIDLVLLDLTMPQRSGLEVFREIRKIDPNVKVILSSGNTPAEPVPGTSFLPKPYRAETLAQAVRSALDAPAHA